jgi:hypothetical protein
MPLKKSVAPAAAPAVALAIAPAVALAIAPAVALAVALEIGWGFSPGIPARHKSGVLTPGTPPKTCQALPLTPKNIISNPQNNLRP